MLKLINNRTNGSFIGVETKFIINGNVVTGVSETNMTASDAMFIKLTFHGLTEGQEIGQVTMTLDCKNIQNLLGVKVIELDNTDISNDSNFSDLASNNSLPVSDMVKVKSDEVSYQEVITQQNTTTYINHHDITLDLTNIVRSSNALNPEVMFMVKFPFGTTSDFRMCSPTITGSNRNIVSAVISEVRGVNGIYKYDEHDFGVNGKVKINLYNGDVHYSNTLLSTLSKKLPITFGIHHNIYSNNANYFSYGLLPNFYYSVYKEGEYVVVEDPTGFKNYFTRISPVEAGWFEGEEFKRFKKTYGIKHVRNDYELYLSYFDNSYLYLYDGHGRTIHELYDKSDTKYYFYNGLLESVTTSSGYELTYEYNSYSHVSRITNSDNEEMLFEYNGNLLQRVVSPSTKKLISFSFDYDEDIVFVSTYKYDSLSNSSTYDLIYETELYLVSIITKIRDVNTGIVLKLNYDYTNRRALSCGLYSDDLETEKCYVTTYTYGDRFTTLTDLENNKLYYYFDYFGRVKTIMDGESKTVTYNYDQYENGEAKRLVGE